MDQQVDPPSERRPVAQINWNAAAFGAALIGGVSYGLVVGVTMIVGPPDWRSWVPVFVLTVGLVAGGLAVYTWLSGSRSRTVGVAMAAAALVGGPFAPLVPLLLAAATAVPRESRRFAVGAGAAAAAGCVFLLVFMVIVQGYINATAPSL